MELNNIYLIHCFQRKNILIFVLLQLLLNLETGPQIYQIVCLQNF